LKRGKKERFWELERNVTGQITVGVPKRGPWNHTRRKNLVFLDPKAVLKDGKWRRVRVNLALSFPTIPR